MSDLRRLQTFLDFVHYGTVAAVAAETRYSTSAVSQQLERLAQELGVPLLEPEGRGLRLTPAGELLAELGPHLLNDWESIRARLAITHGEVSGSVTVAAFQTGCLAFFAEMIASLGDSAPGVKLRCVQAEPEHSVPALHAREVDVAIVERYPGTRAAPGPDLVELPLGRDRMLVAGPEAWGAAAGLAELAERPWVFEAQGSPVRKWAESLCHDAGFTPWIAHETSDVVVQCALAASGAAAAFIPELTPASVRGGAAVAPLPPKCARTILAVTRRSSAGRPAVAAVLAELERQRG